MLSFSTNRFEYTDELKAIFLQMFYLAIIIWGVMIKLIFYEVEGAAQGTVLFVLCFLVCIVNGYLAAESDKIIYDI